MSARRRIRWHYQVNVRISELALRGRSKQDATLSLRRRTGPEIRAESIKIRRGNRIGQHVVLASRTLLEITSIPASAPVTGWFRVTPRGTDGPSPISRVCVTVSDRIRCYRKHQNYSSQAGGLLYNTHQSAEYLFCMTYPLGG